MKKYTVVFEHQEVDYTKDILGIVLDTANIERIDDQRYQLCKEIIKIDHHLVVDSYGTLNYEDSSASSASQLVGTFLKITANEITKSGAEALYLGIVGDTARFMYRNTDERTFAVAGALVQEGIDIVEIYNRIYMKKAKDLQINKFILNNHQFDGGCLLIMF